MTDTSREATPPILPIICFHDKNQPEFILQGTLEKLAGAGKVPLYHPRYFRLTKHELCYYSKFVESDWGKVPIDERGLIPLHLITSVDEHPAERIFDLWVTNKDNNRYPGRNHKKKDIGGAKQYRFRATSVEVKVKWLQEIKLAMSGKEKLQIRDEHEGGTGGLIVSTSHIHVEVVNEHTGESLMKTNIGRLLKGGDDWEDVEIMSEAHMLKVRDEELAASATQRNKIILKTSLGVNGGGEVRHQTFVTGVGGDAPQSCCVTC